MPQDEYPSLKRVQEERVTAAVAHILHQMELAHRTQYRKQVVDAIEWQLREVDRVCGLPRDPIPLRSRALVLAPKVRVPQTEQVRAYVEGVTLSRPVSELEDLLVRTESVELVKRFRRWVAGCDRARLDETVAILDVMTV